MERKAFLEKINNSSGKEKFKALLDYVRYLTRVDTEESQKRAMQALRMAKESKNAQDIISALIHVSYSCYYGGNYQEALTWANKLLKLSTEEKAIHFIGTAHSILGSINTKLGRYSKSIENFLKAMDYYQEAKEDNELIGIYNNLGMVHQMREEFDEAYNYYNLALQSAQAQNNHNLNHIKLNIANIHFMQGDYQGAKRIYEDSIEIFGKLERYNEQASAIQNLGMTYEKLGDPEKAYEYYLEALKLFKGLHENFALAKLLNEICGLLIKQERFEEALSYLQKAEKLSEEHDMKWNLVEVFNTYSSLYEAQGELNKANSYLHKLVEANHAYYKEMSSREIEELEAKHKTQIYKLKNTELNEKNRIMQSQIDDLNNSLEELQLIYTKQQKEFSEAVERINNQDNILSSQSRMAVMGEMLSSIAHQWKQPLNVIAVLSQSIDDAWDFDELDDSFLKKQTSMILSQVNYMSDTINDFRNFFKTDYISSFSVKETIDKSINLVDYLLKRQDTKISVIYDNECYLSGNPNEITQAIVNIINNGMEAMQRNVVAEPKIVIKLNCDEEFVTIRVHNTGEPIKDELLEKIFEPYFTTRSKEGTGLGLHICRYIIENKYHGSVNVENINEGVEFILKIPSKV